MKRLLTFLTAIMLVGWAFAEEEMMLWMLDDPEATTWGGQKVNISAITDINAAQIRVIGDGVGDTVYLNFYNQGNGLWTSVGDMITVDQGKVQPLYVGLGEYGSPDYSFAVELGNWSDTGWTTIATGTTITYDGLVQSRNIRPMGGDSMVIPAVPWNGGAYAVPEPTSGLMMLVGVALLGLRRKRTC